MNWDMIPTAHWLDRFVASTQFEPTSARAAFPCFDEPAYKSSFSIRIRREGRHIALSNMPKVGTVMCLLNVYHVKCESQKGVVVLRLVST